MCMCPMYRWRFDDCWFTDVQYWGVLCVVQVGYGLGVKTVLVSGCFGAQCSVTPDRGQQFKERVSWVWRVQSDFLSPFPYSGGVKFLEARQRGTDNPLSSPDCPLYSSDVCFGSWTKPNSYRWTLYNLNDGRLELFQQLLWQVELPQLAEEIQPMLGFFHDRVNVIVPLQLLIDGGSQESEWLYYSHSAVHEGESRGVPPEVHYHLHSFESV